MSPTPSLKLPLSSSLLESLTYALDATLELRFHSGAVYRYFLVPPAIVCGLLAAPSKGAFFNQHLRTRFRYQRLA